MKTYMQNAMHRRIAKADALLKELAENKIGVDECTRSIAKHILLCPDRNQAVAEFDAGMTHFNTGLQLLTQAIRTTRKFNGK